MLTGLSGGAAILSLRQIHGRLEETTGQIRENVTEQSEQVQQMVRLRSLVAAVDRADLGEFEALGDDLDRAREEWEISDDPELAELHEDFGALVELRRLLLETQCEFERLKQENLAVLQHEISALALQIADDTEFDSTLLIEEAQEEVRSGFSGMAVTTESVLATVRSHLTLRLYCHRITSKLVEGMTADDPALVKYVLVEIETLIETAELELDALPRTEHWNRFDEAVDELSRVSRCLLEEHHAAITGTGGARAETTTPDYSLWANEFVAELGDLALLSFDDAAFDAALRLEEASGIIERDVETMGAVTDRSLWTYQTALNMRRNCSDLAGLVHESLAATDPALVFYLRTRFESLLESAEQALDLLPASATTRSMSLRFEDLANAGGRMFTMKRWTLDFLEEYERRSDEIAEGMQALQNSSLSDYDHARLVAARTLQSSTDLVTRWRTMELAFVVCSFFVAIAFGWVVTRTVVKQLRHLKTGIRIVEAGELDHRVDTGAGDEIGELSRAFDQMTRTLSARDRSIRESEERFRGLFEQSNDGVVFMDRTGRLLDVNHRLAEMTGFSRAELLAMSIDDLHPSEEGSSVIDGIERLEEDGRMQMEAIQRRSDGSVNYVEINAVAIRERDATVQVVIRNITAEKLANQELRRRMEEVSESTHRLEVLVSNTTEREMRMVMLKHEVNELREQMGQPRKYEAPSQVSSSGLTGCLEAIEDREGEAKCP